jgi:hypothetical protein
MRLEINFFSSKVWIGLYISFLTVIFIGSMNAYYLKNPQKFKLKFILIESYFNFVEKFFSHTGNNFFVLKKVYLELKI